MTKIIIPRGYIWLRDVAQDFKWRYFEIKIRLGLGDKKDKDFEYNSFYESLARLQVALASNDMIAMYFGEDDIVRVSCGFWARGEKEELINRGMLAYKNEEEMPVFVEADLYKKFIAWNEELSGTSGSKGQELVTKNPNLYVTPFIDIMLKAVAHFDIREDAAPKIEVIKQWLREQKLPDGKPLSNNQIGTMATFCRPPERMAGGNAKPKRPGKA